MDKGSFRPWRGYGIILEPAAFRALPSTAARYKLWEFPSFRKTCVRPFWCRILAENHIASAVISILI